MSKRVPIIDGLRGIAIVLVIHHHLFESYVTAGWHSFKVGPLTIFPFTFLANGWNGVSLFFMLSGFVLARPYVFGHRGMNSWADARTFFVRRARRLLPLYLFIVVFSAIFLVQSDAASLFAMLTFTYVFTSTYFYPSYNWALWSLGVEFWLSVLFPVILRCIRASSMLHVLIGSFFIAILSRQFGHTFAGTPFPNILIVFSYLYTFVAGMALAAHTQKQNWVTPAWKGLLGLVLVIIGCMLSDAERVHILDTAWLPFPHVVLVTGMYWCVAFLLSRPEHPLTRLMSITPLQWMGARCYSFYVWHAELIMMIHPMNSWPRFIIYFALLPVVSGLSCWLIEQPETWRKLPKLWHRLSSRTAHA